MGSVEDKRDEFTVLVTGFAPFKKEYPQNPSWEIASLLPEFLPLQGNASATAATAALPPVRIVVYPEPVRVSYAFVRDLVPKLWDGQTVRLEDDPSATFTPPPRIDLLLHIGMAGPRLHYSLERFGRRDSYAMRDVDGCLPTVDTDNPEWPWHGVPPAIASDVDLEAALPRWQAYTAPQDCPRMTAPDLRLSIDAGRYLCDFTYFSSLAHLYRRQHNCPVSDRAVPDPDARRRVAFLHVPAVAAPERVAIGRGLVLELIRALVAVEVEARHADRLAVAAKKPLDSSVAPVAVVPEAVTGKWYSE